MLTDSDSNQDSELLSNSSYQDEVVCVIDQVLYLEPDKHLRSAQLHLELANPQNQIQYEP